MNTIMKTIGNTIGNHSAKIVVSTVLVTAMNFALAGPPDAAKTCVDCHHDSGITDSDHIPTIAGAGSFFLENQLAIFSEPARPCEAEAFADHEADDHCAIVGALSEDDKMAIAEYFGELPFESFEQDFDAGLADKGQSIHNASCDRCHTDSGAEAFDESGILAGQPMPYLIEQFEFYKTGDRWQPESMAEEMQKLDEEQMKALAHFYARAGQ